MTTNFILKKSFFATIIKSGKEIRLSGATETTKWTRPQFVVDLICPGFVKSVEARVDLLPADVVEIVGREADHPSEKDPRQHYTGVMYDKDGNYLGTAHFPAAAGT